MSADMTDQAVKASNQSGSTTTDISTVTLLTNIAKNVVLPPVLTAVMTTAVYQITAGGRGGSMRPIPLAVGSVVGRLASKITLDLINGQDYASELKPLRTGAGWLATGIESAGVVAGYQLAYSGASVSRRKILVGTYLGAVIADTVLQPVVYSLIAGV